MKITGWIILRNGKLLPMPFPVFSSKQSAALYYGGATWCARNGFKAVKVSMETEEGTK